MSIKSKLVLSLLVNSFTFFSILFFAPLDIYLGNIINFSFSFNSFWWILLLFALGIVLIVSVIEMLFPELLCQISNVLIFAIGICCYIQSMFLNGAMSTLTGESPVYESSLTITNIVILMMVFLILIILLISFHIMHRGGVYVRFVSFISCALIIMQSVALITTLLSTDVSSYKRVQYLTDEGEFELSAKDNVIVFILDTCDDELYVDPLLEKEPETFESLKGFTYYPNATSTYSRTYPAVPYLLTKEKCYFDTPYYQYIDPAYDNSTYLKDLNNTGADIRVFTDSQYVGKSSSNYIDNIGTNKESLSFQNTIRLIKKMAKISLYRSTPYIVKSKFIYTNSEINNIFVADNGAIHENEIKFYKYLVDKGLSKNENYSKSYRFYHLFGTHSGAFWDENLNWKSGATMEEALKGDIKLITEYIQQMQELGIYENSTIIITADHGYSGAGEPMLYMGPRPIMMVKPAGKGMSDNFDISGAPVAQDDLFPAIINALGGNGDLYGRDIYTISENYNSERSFYYSALITDEDGEIALIKYNIIGDARDFSNWIYTGKYWDINYSERTVSKKRLIDYISEKPQKGHE